MARDFTQAKKEELYKALDLIDDREWKPFMAWCGGRAGEFGEWADRLGISSYTRQIENFQNKILEISSSTREQMDIIFENVAETDRRYAEIFRGHAEAVQEQIKRVQTMIQVMQSANRNGTEIKMTACGTDLQAGVPYEERLENGRRILESYLKGRGITDPAERQRICDLIMEHQPGMLENLYLAECCGSGDSNKAYDMLINYYNGHYFGKYPYPVAYIEGILKAYETHKMIDGRFVLDNGSTIGYGHDVQEGEDFSDGLSEAEALELAIADMDEKYSDIITCMRQINEMTGLNLNERNFSENEIMFLVDFAYNRGRGLVEWPGLSKDQPHTSLALLIIAVSEGDDEKIISILKEEVYSRKGEYYRGLERRRMDEYEILKEGDYERDYDMERGVW